MKLFNLFDCYNGVNKNLNGMFLRKSVGTILIGAYLFFLSWDSFFLVGLNFPIAPSYFFLSLIALTFVIVSIPRGNVFFLPQFLWPLMVLLIYCTFTLLWTPNLSSGFSTVILLWSYFITLILIYTVARYINPSITLLIWSYVLGVLSIGAYSWAVGYFTKGRLAYSEGANPTFYAGLLAVAIISIVSFSPKVKTIGKLLALLSLLFMIILLLITQGRNAIIALGLSFLIALIARHVFFDRQKLDLIIMKKSLETFSRTFFVLIFIVSITIGIIFYTGLYKDLSRVMLISELISGDINRATAGRGFIWANFSEIIYQTAATGGGVRSARLLYGNMQGYETTPHNIYLLMLIEYGILGLFLWFVFLIGLTRLSIFNKTKSFALVWLAFFTILFGIGNDILYYKYWWVGLLLYLVHYADIRNEINHERLVNNIKPTILSISQLDAEDN